MSVLNPFSYFGVGYIGSVNVVLWSHLISNNSEKSFFFENVCSADWLNVANDLPHCLKLVYLINKLVGKKPDLAYHWYSTHLKTFQMFCIIVHLIISTQLIRTVKFTATYLKCVSSLDFSLKATWAGHWLLGRPKQLKREKSRAESQQQILRQQTNVPY